MGIGGVRMQDRFKFRFFETYNNTMLDCKDYDFNEILENGKPVMQCTGLKDKNGKLIYEGDVVKFAFHELAEEKAFEKAVIVWGDKYKYPAFDLDKCEFECNGLSYIFNEGWVIEVIGNIYENPELLED
jgi:uncharacterized phage protein (TIGR01671 family)